MTFFSIPLEALWRIAAACLLAGLIGMEREIDDQPAGLRTHLTVGLGASLFGTVSTLAFLEYAHLAGSGVRIEITRVASEVVVGIGFLGAGLIFRHGMGVRNLTTAASLWVTAAVGLAAGIGAIGLAAAGTFALLIALGLLQLPRNLVRRRLTRRRRQVYLTLASGAEPTALLESFTAGSGLRCLECQYGYERGKWVLAVTIEGDRGVDVDEAVRRLIQSTLVDEARMPELEGLSSS